MMAAKFFPQITFYSYTKSIKFLLAYIKKNGGLPKNFVFTCSRGGKYDNLIPSTMVKSAKVFFSTDEAKALGLDIDHTDDLAISGSDALVHRRTRAGAGKTLLQPRALLAVPDPHLPERLDNPLDPGLARFSGRA